MAENGQKLGGQVLNSCLEIILVSKQDYLFCDFIISESE